MQRQARPFLRAHLISSWKENDKTNLHQLYLVEYQYKYACLEITNIYSPV